MVKLTGPGNGQTLQHIHRVPINCRHVSITWMVVDESDPDNVVQADLASLANNPTISIHRRFQDGYDLWEKFDINPISLNSESLAVANELLGGGDYRITLNNLDSSLNLWIKFLND